MNPYIKQEWVKQLKSGNFIQIQGELRGDDNQRCALGVLVDVFIKYHPRVSGWAKSDDGSWQLAVHNGLGGFQIHDVEAHLPDVVRDWAGLDCNDPEVDDGQSVVDLNDNCYKEFDEISQLISHSSL